MKERAGASSAKGPSPPTRFPPSLPKDEPRDSQAASPTSLVLAADGDGCGRGGRFSDGGEYSDCPHRVIAGIAASGRHCRLRGGGVLRAPVSRAARAAGSWL